MMNTEFLGVWWDNLQVSRSSLDMLQEYLSKDDYITDFSKNQWCDLPIRSDHDNASNLLLYDTYNEGVKISLDYHWDRYLSYMLVYKYSVIEQVVKEASYLMFVYRPEWIHKVENVTETFRLKDIVNFNDIIKYGNTDIVIEIVAEKAANALVSGSLTKSLKRLSKIIRNNFNKEVLDAFDNLQMLRNRVVHENAILNLDPEYFDNLMKIIYSFFTQLSNMMRKNRIPYGFK